MSVVQCPVCNGWVHRLIAGFNGEGDGTLISKIREAVPTWSPQDGICSHCVDHANLYLLHHASHDPLSLDTAFDPPIYPIGLRLNAIPHYTGKGVTLAVIDSGFYRHPDLVKPYNRIKAAIDITRPEVGDDFLDRPSDASWHGTMTSVVGAGNGFLSGGIYRSLAWESDVVLIKVHDGKNITGENIARALRWVIDHASRYDIRIVNLSVTDDWPLSYETSAVAIAVQEAVEMGIVVLAAVGNDPAASIKPPANSPHAITLGGVDDHNTIFRLGASLYHSTYGMTVDRLLKPDLIAPAIWIPAPILPATMAAREARLLYDRYFASAEPKVIDGLSPNERRRSVRQRILDAKYITPHYQHADGTSFAAPIVSGIVAQMLQANPDLTPSIVREILLSTANRLPGVPAERQGYGVVNAHAAVEYVVRDRHATHGASPDVNYRRKRLAFRYHNHAARSVALSASFTNWSLIPMKPHRGGQWILELPLPKSGRHRYKFVVDATQWIADPRNPFREPDGFDNFNSQLIVQ